MSLRPFRTLTIGLVLVFSASAMSFAQTKSPSPPKAPAVQVNHHELLRFVTAWNTVQKVQHRLAKSINADISKSSLPPARFDQIYNSKLSGAKVRPKLTNQEQQEYQALSHEIHGMQRLAEQEMVRAVRSDGLKISRFNQIALAIQSDSKLKKRFLRLEQAG